MFFSLRINAILLLIMSMLVPLSLLSCGPKFTEPITLNSPDGKIVATVTRKGGNTKIALRYSVTLNGAPVVTDSQLGISLKDYGCISDWLDITEVTFTSTDETYTLPFGKCTDVRDRYNEVRISLSAPKNDCILDLVFRAYDDGIAFRYHFPEQEGMKEIEVISEVSSFLFPGNPHYWGVHVPGYTTSYENDYTAATLENITSDSLTVLPLLVRVSDDAWVGITEANLTDYAGMYLRGAPGGVIICLAPLPEEPGVCVRATTPHSSPWRVLMIADDPGRLIESNIILNLNDPCTFDTSWIKPGKTAWDWWSGQVVKGAGFEGSMDNRTMKHYIDFAAELGLEYMLIDADWYERLNGEFFDQEKLEKSDITTSIPEIDIPSLVAYANGKGVDIIVWLHWLPTNRQMDEAFALYEQWGVKGVKIDFMDSDHQDMVNFYHRTLKKAAEHHLTVDFHGAYKPTGIRRTYPNLLTREGVMGLEYSKWSHRITPDHDCTIPFTRMLAGPLDYTPGGFSNATKEQFTPRFKEPMTQGTRCHQLALFVIFESPLQMVPDYPENYRRKKDGPDFIRNVPVVWDETRVLNGEVGEYVTIARKNGAEWYLGSITDWTPREITARLDFLGSGDFIAEIYADGPDTATNAEQVTMSRVLVSPEQELTITMGPGGGQAVRFYPAPADTELPRYGH